MNADFVLLCTQFDFLRAEFGGEKIKGAQTDSLICSYASYIL